MPTLPKQPRPPNSQAIRQAWADEHSAARRARAQFVRLLVAGPGSVVGRYPLGNTGGADVNAMLPMPIPADLQAVLDGVDPVSS